MTLLKDLIQINEERGKYSTYASWKAACRKADSTCWFEGDKDIGQAMIGPKPFKRGETFSIGEWDGETGEVFPRPGSKKVTEMFANRGSGHAEPDGDDDRIKYVVKYKRADGKIMTAKKKAENVAELKDYYGKDFVSAEPDYESMNEEEKLTAEKAEKHGHTWLVKFTHCPGKEDRREQSIRSVKAISSSQAVAAAKAKLPTELRDCAEVEDVQLIDKKDVKESAEYAKQLVRGEKAGPGLLNKLDHWFSKMIITKDKNRFVPAEIALKQLRKAGFSEDQITLIRDAATKAANTAVETMHKKHGEEAVPRKYISALPSSFGVFDLYLNVGSDIHEEFAALMRKLFDAKIDKIKDKLNIVKEDTALQGLGKALKPSAKAEEPAKTDVNTPPAEKAAADDAATDEPADVSDAPAENVEPEAAFKVGDIVKPLKGPHKGEPHEVIHVFDDGAMNIRPKDLDAKAVKYRLGAAKAQPDEVVLAEGKKITGSLLTQVVSLTEAKKAPSLDELKKKAREVSDEMDRIIMDGGRILANDPLSVKLAALRREIAKAKKAGAK